MQRNGRVGPKIAWLSLWRETGNLDLAGSGSGKDVKRVQTRKGGKLLDYLVIVFW